MPFGHRPKKRGSGSRDFGLPSSGAGKGSAPRNLSPRFRQNFPASLTGDVPGFTRKGSKLVKTYGRLAGPTLPEVAEHFPQSPIRATGNWGFRDFSKYYPQH